MSSRADKERQLKKNVEINTARAIRQHEKDHGSADDGIKQYYRKAFEESAQRVDKKLPKLWNKDSKQKAIPDNTRPEFGYFGGVDFDEQGNIRK